MKLALVAAAAALLLVGCETVQSVYDDATDRFCQAPLNVRFARSVIAAHYTGQAIVFDCDRDGKPDELGTWVAPE